MSADATFFIGACIAVVIFFGTPALAVVRERSERRLTRRGFLPWQIAAFAMLGAIGLSPNFGGAGALAIVVGYLAFAYLFAQRTVRRVRDIGAGKGICYVFAMPVKGMLLAATLLLFRSAAPAQATTGSTSTR